MSSYKVPNIKKSKIDGREIKINPYLITYKIHAKVPVELYFERDGNGQFVNDFYVEIQKHGKIYKGHFSLEDSKYKLNEYEVRDGNGELIGILGKDYAKNLNKKFHKNAKVFEENAEFLLGDLRHQKRRELRNVLYQVKTSQGNLTNFFTEEMLTLLGLVS